MSLEEIRNIAHLGGISSEEREQVLVRIVIELKDMLPGKREIAALKTGDALYSYQERVDFLIKINSHCESRFSALSKEEREIWDCACELEHVKMLWDMLADIHKFNVLCDFKHPSAFAFFIEYIKLYLFQSQRMIGRIYEKFGVYTLNE